MAFVEVTKKDHIAVVTMNRPEALNALNKAVFTDLEVALDDVERDDEVYVVIITGAGRAFIAGADIGEMAPMNVAEGLAFSELGNRILMRVDMMEKPTIAAVNGFALGGGCEMALACDIDVYKRQAMWRKGRSAPRGSPGPSWVCGPSAVSYTHLDVYKRQSPTTSTERSWAPGEPWTSPPG